MPKLFCQSMLFPFVSTHVGSALLDVHINGEVEVVNGSPPPVRNRKHEPVLLLMIGCQGSGKTKFSLDLVQYGAITWARINQDTLRGPSTRGLREECVVKARQLLELGYCIVVDRMNFTDGELSFAFLLSS